MMDLDEEYVVARRVLLDALTALAPHGPAFIVAGAQAIYLRTGHVELDETVAPYTTDGDLALDPGQLGEAPELEVVMRAAGFDLLVTGRDSVEPGIWVKPVLIAGRTAHVPVDLIVPEEAAPPGGRRGARLGVHGKRAARRAPGLEAVLVDNSAMSVVALDSADVRVVKTKVAGYAGMLVAKLHKIHDRSAEGGRQDRLKDKDASDVVRIMQSTSGGVVGLTLAELLGDETARGVTKAALTYLPELFGRRGALGIQMAGRALRQGMPEQQIEVLSLAFVERLMETVGDG